MKTIYTTTGCFPHELSMFCTRRDKLGHEIWTYSSRDCTTNIFQGKNISNIHTTTTRRLLNILSRARNVHDNHTTHQDVIDTGREGLTASTRQSHVVVLGPAADARGLSRSPFALNLRVIHTTLARQNWRLELGTQGGELFFYTKNVYRK